jgi:hypothetical protein
MIQKTMIAAALGSVVLGALPANAADFGVPPGTPYYEAPQYSEPPQVYAPPVRYGYVPVAPPVYAPPAVVVAPAPNYYDEPYYVARPPAYVYPRYAYPRYGVYPRDDWRARRPYVERRYTNYRDWGPGYRRW